MRVLNGRHGHVFLTYLTRPAFRGLGLALAAIAAGGAYVVLMPLFDPFSQSRLSGLRFASGALGSVLFFVAFLIYCSPAILLITFAATLMWHLREQLQNPLADLVPEFRRTHVRMATFIFLSVPLLICVGVYGFGIATIELRIHHAAFADAGAGYRAWKEDGLLTLTLGVLAVTLLLMTLTAVWASSRSPWSSLLMFPLFLLALTWEPLGRFIGGLIEGYGSRDSAVSVIGISILLLATLRQRLGRRPAERPAHRRADARRRVRPQDQVASARAHRVMATTLSRAWHRRHGVLHPLAPWAVAGILSLLLVCVPLVFGARQADLLRSLLLPTLVPGVAISAIWRERWLNLGYESLYPANRSEFVSELAAATAISLAELWLATAIAVILPIAVWDAGLLKQPIFYVTLAASAAMQFLVFGVMFVSALFRPLLPYVNLVTILATLVPITFAWAQTSKLSPHGLLLVAAIEMAAGLMLTAFGSSAWRRADLA